MNRFVKKRVFAAKAGARGGKRAYLGGLFVRSSWEANVCLWLNELKRRGEILEWFYEDREFLFPVKRGVRFYKPDFRVVEDAGQEIFYEVKGHLDSKSVTALTRMKRYYPETTVLLIEKAKYAEICSEFGHLENWERK